MKIKLSDLKEFVLTKNADEKIIDFSIKILDGGVLKTKPIEGFNKTGFLIDIYSSGTGASEQINFDLVKKADVPTLASIYQTYDYNGTDRIINDIVLAKNLNTKIADLQPDTTNINGVALIGSEDERAGTTSGGDSLYSVNDVIKISEFQAKRKQFLFDFSNPTKSLTIYTFTNNPDINGGLINPNHVFHKDQVNIWIFKGFTTK